MNASVLTSHLDNFKTTLAQAGLSPSEVACILNSPAFQPFFAALQENLVLKEREAARRAATCQRVRKHRAISRAKQRSTLHPPHKTLV
jgi:hypothetical protein